MEYVRFGKTGLLVSRLCLGCMSYGDPSKGMHGWVLTEEQGRPFIKRAIEQGINFFDTANAYSLGASEEVLGRAIKDFASREDMVIATKVWAPMRTSPNGSGLSRKAIMNEIDASLKRLGTDYVDLYQIHRWDYNVPIEETLEAMHDVVRAGKARYIGASSMQAWQFAKALYLADARGWTRFVSMQNYYNLLYREEEREMMKLCEAEGIAVIPWSPLARGKLSRVAAEQDATPRSTSDVQIKNLYRKTVDIDRDVIKRVEQVAKKRGVPMAQLALAWVLHKNPVTAPIIGATKPQHLEDAFAALELKLSDEEIASLEEAYVPHAVAGHE